MTEEKKEIETSRFKLMEAADNAQILAEINGTMLKDMVYSVKGKTKLSYAGAKFAAIKLGDIHIRNSEVSFNKDLDQWEASALAYNGNMNITLPGYAEQPRLMNVQEELIPDEFARRKAASKAIRNALMAVMPADHIAAYMKAAIDGGQTRNLEPPRKQVKSTQKTEARVGDPPRQEPPRPPQPQSKQPQNPPKTLDELDYSLREKIPGLDETLVLSDRGKFLRIGKKRQLGTDEENMIELWINEFGGEWSNEDNCWKINKNITSED